MTCLFIFNHLCTFSNKLFCRWIGLIVAIRKSTVKSTEAGAHSHVQPLWSIAAGARYWRQFLCTSIIPPLNTLSFLCCICVDSTAYWIWMEISWYKWHMMCTCGYLSRFIIYWTSNIWLWYSHDTAITQSCCFNKWWIWIWCDKVVRTPVRWSVAVALLLYFKSALIECLLSNGSVCLELTAVLLCLV